MIHTPPCRGPNQHRQGIGQSAYTGLEGIFLAVAKRVDENVPAGERWHMDLLDQVASSTETRGKVISAATRQNLADYLAFRHFFRHAYAHVFEWDEMRHLVEHSRPDAGPRFAVER